VCEALAPITNYELRFFNHNRHKEDTKNTSAQSAIYDLQLTIDELMVIVYIAIYNFKSRRDSTLLTADFNLHIITLSPPPSPGVGLDGSL